VALEERGVILAGPEVRARSIKRVASTLGGRVADSPCPWRDMRTRCAIYSECRGRAATLDATKCDSSTEMVAIRDRQAASSRGPRACSSSHARPPKPSIRSELMRLATGHGLAVHHTFTCDSPAAWRGFARRLGAHLLKAIGPAPARRPRIFVCGPTAFVNRAVDLLVQLGHESKRIRVEDFGPDGRLTHSRPSADDSKSSRRVGAHTCSPGRWDRASAR
jgi:hypothetical protein